MKTKPPYSIFLGLFLFAATLCLAAQQAAQGKAAQSLQSQTESVAPAALSPKELLEEKARVQIAEKRYEAAIQTYQDLLKNDAKNAIYLNMIGIANLDLGNFDQAKKYFIRASKADKKYASAVNNLGMVYYHQKDFRRAIREYQRAVAIDPNQGGAHANLGFAFYNSNKYPEAATEFQKAIELDPRIFERNDRAGTTVQDRSVNNHGLFFFTMAKVYAQKGDAGHCAEYLRKSLDEGYKDIAKATTDPAFKDVINDPDVQAVLVRAVPVEQKGTATHPGV
jgi:tetratricopeptide (TPR) repeat protein